MAVSVIPALLYEERESQTGGSSKARTTEPGTNIRQATKHPISNKVEGKDYHPRWPFDLHTHREREG